MRKFKAGEKARYVGCSKTVNPVCISYLQQQVTVAGPFPVLPRGEDGAYNYKVIASNGFDFGVVEASLRKLLPDSDSYQRGSWDEFNRIINQPITQDAD